MSANDLVCSICGAVIADRFIHVQWHQDTNTDGLP